ncbi:MAG: spermine/spermidine synthase domain-containing protein [Planctomycetota bacterium]
MKHPPTDRTDNPVDRRMILAATFLAGFLAQTAQIVLLRELLMAFSGLEIVLGVALASWMFLVAAGAWIAGAALRPAGAGTRFLHWGLSAAFLPVGASAILARVAPGALDLAPGEFPGLGSSLGLSLVVLLPACLLVGALFVAASKALQDIQPTRAAGGAVGLAYLVEAGGSAVAGAAFSFLLVHLLGPFTLLFLACAAGGILGTFGAFERRRIAAGWGTAVLTVCALGASLAGPGIDRALAARQRGGTLPDRDAESRAVEGVETGEGREERGFRFLGIRESKYGRIVVTRYRGQTNFFTAGHLAFSIPDWEGAASLAHSVMVEHPSPRKVLLIGGGVAGLVREILKHGVETLETVELDPVLIETVKAFEPDAAKALEDPLVRGIPGDARAYVKRASPHQFDVVLVDVPDPETAALNRYYTREFFEETKKILAPGGLVAFTLSGSAHYLGEEILTRNGTLYHTFLGVFPHVLVWPGETFIYFGATAGGILRHEPAPLAERFRIRRIRFPWMCPSCSSPPSEGPGPCPVCGGPLAGVEWFTEHHFEMKLPREDVLRVNRELRRWPLEVSEGEKQALPAFMTGVGTGEVLPWEDPVPEAVRTANTDGTPGATLQNLMLWHRIMGEGVWAWGVKSMAGLGGKLWAILAGCVALPLLFALGWRRRRAGAWPFQWGLGAVVGFVGFSELAMEMAILLGFQGRYGYLYREIGVLFGAFMLGLGVGGWVSLAWVPKRVGPLCGIIAGTAVFGGALPGLLWGLRMLPPPSAFPIYLLLAAVGGLPVGLVFPVAACLYAGKGRSAGGTAAVLYGADLLGGIAGALLAGPLLFPALGIRRTLFFEVVPLLLAGVLLLLASRWVAAHGEEPPPLGGGSDPAHGVGLT